MKNVQLLNQPMPRWRCPMFFLAIGLLPRLSSTMISYPWILLETPICLRYFDRFFYFPNHPFLSPPFGSSWAMWGVPWGPGPWPGLRGSFARAGGVQVDHEAKSAQESGAHRAAAHLASGSLDFIMIGISVYKKNMIFLYTWSKYNIQYTCFSIWLNI